MKGMNENGVFWIEYLSKHVIHQLKLNLKTNSCESSLKKHYQQIMLSNTFLYSKKVTCRLIGLHY